MTGLVHEGAPLVPVVLKNDSFPAAVRVFEDKAVAEWMLSATAGEVVKITDDGSLEIANAVAVRLAQALKAIDARDKELRGPLKQTLDAVRDVTDAIREPIERAKRALVNKIGLFDQARKQAREKLLEEAKAAHAAELAKMQADAAAKAKAAQDEKEREAREFAELMGEAPPAPTAAPAPPPASSFASQVLSTLPSAPAKAPEPTVTASATMKRVQRLRIIDPSKIPWKIGSDVLMSPNEAAIMRVLKAGAVLEGAELYWEEQASLKPTREPDPHFG